MKEMLRLLMLVVQLISSFNTLEFTKFKEDLFTKFVDSPISSHKMSAGAGAARGEVRKGGEGGR